MMSRGKAETLFWVILPSGSVGPFWDRASAEKFIDVQGYKEHSIVEADWDWRDAKRKVVNKLNRKE